MTVVALVGTQWGDEGKGKITDVLASKADVVVRYQGNSGTTVVVASKPQAPPHPSAYSPQEPPALAIV